MTTVTTLPNEGGFMHGCFVAARSYSEPSPLFRADDKGVRAYLDRYAVIPMEVFEAMGGAEHPAFKAYHERARDEFNAQNDTAHNHDHARA